MLEKLKKLKSSGNIKLRNWKIGDLQTGSCSHLNASLENYENQKDDLQFLKKQNSWWITEKQGGAGQLHHFNF